MQDEDVTKDPIIEPVDMAEDEDVVQFEYNEDGEEDLKATLKKLRKDLREVQKEKLEYLTNWQRERADFQNYKKDEAERAKRIVDMAREGFIEDLLPVLDSYDMAFANREAWEKVDKNWRMGVEYIHQQLIKTLTDQGVAEIAPNIGDGFDATLHQTIESIPTEDVAQDNSIAKVLQKGYKNGERVIRPARVNVYAVVVK